jgi:hypothetical protein
MSEADSGQPLIEAPPYVYAIDEEVQLPREPQHDGKVVIEAMHRDGGMAVVWRHASGDLWSAFGGRRNRRPEDWANIVEAAIRYRWRLVIRRVGDLPEGGA